MRSWLSATMLAAVLAIAAPALGQTIDATDASKVAKAMQDLGWQAKLSTDGDGDPLITSKVSRTEYRVTFYGCTRNTDCQSIMLGAYTTTKKMTFEQANTWNRTKRFGTMTIDKDGDPHMLLEVNLAGGVSTKNFEDVLDRWRTTIEDFEKISAP